MPDPKEMWVPVQGFEGYYEVSNLGRLKSLAKLRVKRKHDYIMSPGKDTGGYLQLSLQGGGKYKLYKLHQVVAIAFLPNPENKREVNHIDGDKRNNRVENLEWSTRLENLRHAYDAGLMRELSAEDVLSIYVWTDYGAKQTDLAKFYDIHPSQISKILSGTRWKHLYAQHRTGN